MLTYCEDTLDLSPYHSSSKNKKAVVITTVSCCLSILGAAGIFVTFYKIKEIRNFVRSLMVCLTVADFCTATGYLVATLRHYGNQGDKVSCELCIIQSFITTFSSLVSFFLTMFIALHIFLTIYNVRPVTGTRRYLVLFNGISVLIPGTIVVAAIFCNVLGQDVTKSSQGGGGTGPWCWIHINRTTEVQQYNRTSNNIRGLDPKTIMWMTVTGKGWEILCYLVTTTLYVLLKLHLYMKHRNRQFQEIHNSLRNEDKNYIMVFLVLF